MLPLVAETTYINALLDQDEEKLAGTQGCRQALSRRFSEIHYMFMMSKYTTLHCSMVSR